MLSKRIVNMFIYLCFSITVVMMLWTDKMAFFLHPRMVKYVIFALLCFVVMAIYELYEIEQLVKNDDFSSGDIPKGYIIYFILFGLVTLNPTEISSAVIENKSTDFLISINEITEEQKLIKENNNLIEFTDRPVRDNDFMDIIWSIRENPNELNGQKVSIEGFIYRDETFEDNVFVVGRMVVTCCVADAVVTGMFVESEIANEFETDIWVRVEGTISIEEVYDSKDDKFYSKVYIIDSEILQIEPHDTDYVYGDR